MKKIIFNMSILLISVLFLNTPLYSQIKSKVKKKPITTHKVTEVSNFKTITPLIADKLSYAIVDNSELYSECRDIIGMVSGGEKSHEDIDKILLNLSHDFNSTCACFYFLYHDFGITTMYFVLKKYMKIDEIDLVEKLVNELKVKRTDDTFFKIP